MKILVVGAVGDVEQLSQSLAQPERQVVTAADLVEATELLFEQQFNAVFLACRVPQTEIEEFTTALRELDRRAGTGNRTAVLLVVPPSSEEADHATVPSGIDEIVTDSLDADALTLAIARLGSAVAVAKGPSNAPELAPELAVLDEEELKAQVAYDTELLVEIIDLYFGERSKQSPEMWEALDAEDYDRLSKIAHTIKGSLGSLHADASRVTAQNLEMAARESDDAKCRDFLTVLDQQLDLLEECLRAVRNSLA